MSHSTTTEIESKEKSETSVEDLAEKYTLYRVFSTDGFVSASIEDVFVHEMFHYFEISVSDENSDLSFYIELHRIGRFLESYNALAPFIEERNGQIAILEDNEMFIDVEITENEYTNDYLHITHTDTGKTDKVKFRDSLPDDAERLDEDQQSELLHILKAAEFYYTKKGRFEDGVAVHLGDIVGTSGDNEQYVRVELPFEVGESSTFNTGGTAVEIPVPSMEGDLSDAEKGYEFIEYCGGSVDDLSGAYVYVSADLRHGGLVTDDEIFRVYTKDQFVQSDSSTEVCETCSRLAVDPKDGDCDECYTEPTPVDEMLYIFENIQVRFKTISILYIWSVLFLFVGYLAPSGGVSVLNYTGGLMSFVLSIVLTAVFLYGE